MLGDIGATTEKNEFIQPQSKKRGQCELLDDDDGEEEEVVHEFDPNELAFNNILPSPKASCLRIIKFKRSHTSDRSLVFMKKLSPELVRRYELSFAICE